MPPSVPGHCWSSLLLSEKLHKLALPPEEIVTCPVPQNHSTAGVDRDLCGSPSPTPLPKQGHPEQAAQDRVQVGLEYLQRRRLHSLPGQPVPQP